MCRSRGLGGGPGLGMGEFAQCHNAAGQSICRVNELVHSHIFQSSSGLTLQLLTCQEDKDGISFSQMHYCKPNKDTRLKETSAQVINPPFIRLTVFTTCPSGLFTSIMAIDRCQFGTILYFPPASCP